MGRNLNRFSNIFSHQIWISILWASVFVFTGMEALGLTKSRFGTGLCYLATYCLVCNRLGNFIRSWHFRYFFRTQFF